jgi:hypothetical protein
VALGFGPAVYGVVLRRGHGLQPPGIVALHAAHVRHAHPRGEVRALPEGLVAPAPARVAEDVDVRAPVGEADVDVEDALLRQLVVLCPGLVADGPGHAQQQVGVEGRSEADALGEDGRESSPTHAVQPLGLVVVRRYAQPGDGRRAVHELGDLLVERHARYEALRPLGGRQARPHPGGAHGSRRPQRARGGDSAPSRFLGRSLRGGARRAFFPFAGAFDFRAAACSVFFPVRMTPSPGEEHRDAPASGQGG